MSVNGTICSVLVLAMLGKALPHTSASCQKRGGKKEIVQLVFSSALSTCPIIPSMLPGLSQEQTEVAASMIDFTMQLKSLLSTLQVNRR